MVATYTKYTEHLNMFKTVYEFISLYSMIFFNIVSFSGVFPSFPSMFNHRPDNVLFTQPSLMADLSVPICLQNQTSVCQVFFLSTQSNLHAYIQLFGYTQHMTSAIFNQCFPGYACSWYCIKI